jgi:hypothetical protein
MGQKNFLNKEKLIFAEFFDPILAQFDKKFLKAI